MTNARLDRVVPVPSDRKAVRRRAPRWREYLTLTKPRVTQHIVLTAVVGMVLAPPQGATTVQLLAAIVGIALASGSAAAFNQVLDRNVDARMARTSRRPLAAMTLRTTEAIAFATVLGMASITLLWTLVGRLTTVLTASSLIGYALVYTRWLKYTTPQNIVIGGAAGAMPPILGWSAVTQSVDPPAIILFLIIFTWTPPHFWALAIAKRDEYALVGIPMLPVTHGVDYTARQILVYTALLAIASLVPVFWGISGMLYLSVAVGLGARFLYFATRLARNPQPVSGWPMRTFRYSITYLAWLFVALIADHCAPIGLLWD